MNPKREFDIDFFRGWVCLSLVMLHFYNSNLFDSYYRLFGAQGETIVWNWRLGIESFFVLAGFMMGHMLRPVPGEEVAISGYLKRRFFRLILPYWTAVLLFALYRWVLDWYFMPMPPPRSATSSRNSSWYKSFSSIRKISKESCRSAIGRWCRSSSFI